MAVSKAQKSLETGEVFKILQRKRQPFPGRSKGHQSGCGQPRQSLWTMHTHGSAGFSSLSFAGLAPENRILWVRILACAEGCASEASAEACGIYPAKLHNK
jgi:hypothetical protein